MKNALVVPGHVAECMTDEQYDLVSVPELHEGVTAPKLWHILAAVFIPVVNHNTIKHICWRYNMFTYSKHITHDLPVPDFILSHQFLYPFVGCEAPEVPAKSHAEFCRVYLNPDLPFLSGGQMKVALEPRVGMTFA